MSSDEIKIGRIKNAVRKTLGKIAVSLGPNYLSFIFKELKTALSKRFTNSCFEFHRTLFINLCGHHIKTF